MPDDRNYMQFPEDILKNGQMLTAVEWIAEQIPGGFFIYRADDSQEILYINSAMLRIFGCQTVEEFKELTGNTFRGMVHPQDVIKIQKSIDEQIADEHNQNLDYVEYRIIRKDGSIRWVDDYGHLGEFPGYGKAYYVFISDITEKHYLQEENYRWLNIYQGMVAQFNVLSGSSLSVIRANLTAGVIEEVRGNDLYDTDYVGGNIAEMIQKRLDSFLILDDRQRYEEIFQFGKLIDHYYHGGEPTSLVGYCQRQSGRKCFVKTAVRAAINPISGDVIVFFTETEYNTEKVTHVLNKKLLAQQYDMVAYLLGDNYGVVIGEASNIRRGSIFPQQRDGNFTEYILQQVVPVIQGTEEEREEIVRALSISTVERYLASHDSYTVDVVCKIEEEIFHKRFHFYSVDKEMKFYILLKSDITDVIRKEHEMNALLEDALREAKNANAAKTTFLSNMSHEIRTPMNAIVGLDSIALQIPDLSPQVREYLEKIGTSAKHLLTIINDILDMSRIESGRMRLKKEEFSFNDMLDQINAMIQPQCRDKGLTYTCTILGKLNDDYIGDEMKLKQILINILSNAVKFTDARGTVTMTIEQVAEFEENSTLQFVITDTGIGMEQSYLPRIFDTFSQENSHSANKFGSTGLGMAITKNLVEMMNGNITVKSEKGKGSQFTVTVTLHKSEKTEIRGNDFDLKKMRTLVIDDDVIACQHAQLVLEEAGISADAAIGSQEAWNMIELHHAKQEPYHLVLIDWKMSDEDGVELTRRIRQRYDDKTAIIILTAYNWDEIMEEALEAGVDSFMSKPLFASNVLNEFERVMKRRYRLKKVPAPVDLTGKRILLAEDVKINAEIMKKIFSMRNMQVDHAEDGKKTLEMFAASEIGYYDAVLMDVRMPVMDGLQSASAIRALDRPDAGTIPIIAMTANAFDEDVQNSLQAGMNAHLSKPVEIDRLFKTLEKLIGETKNSERS